jgi:Uma2 family endonuclease
MNGAVFAPRRYAVSADEFLQMGAAGVFAPGVRLELIDGEIIEMSPIGSPHASVLAELTRRLNFAAGERAIARPQCPLVLGEESAPEPDIALLKPRTDRYFGRHPRAADALLVIEVSDGTLQFDLRTKAPLYARAGVVEMWVVDVDRREIRVFRDPDPSGYRTTFAVSGSTAVQPLAFPDISVPVETLFPPPRCDLKQRAPQGRRTCRSALRLRLVPAVQARGTLIVSSPVASRIKRHSSSCGRVLVLR